MRLNKCVAIAILVPTAACADGFKLRLEGNKIVARNNVNVTPDNLFGHAFDVTNSVLGTYETSHGSVDANDAGSGFNFTDGSSNDAFQYNIKSLWTYAGGVAVPAPSGAIMEVQRASNGDLLSTIEGQAASPPAFSITATSTHELLWSVPQSTSFEVWGLAYTVTAQSSSTGLPYDESELLIAVQWTPLYGGGIDDAMQAIYAAATVGTPGDFDHDGDVDGGDLLRWQRGLGSDMGVAELENWRRNFGRSAPEIAAIPEPSGVILTTVGAAFACRALRPRRGSRG